MNGDWLSQHFESDRQRLHEVAYRLLGSRSDADDAVQETWIRLNRSNSDDIENLTGWLTTVIARVSLDMLRSRRTRREDPIAPDVDAVDEAVDPEREAILADSVGLAMQVVLQRLSPTERVAFVLHDVFGMPFDEIAEIIGRSPTATRQLASRGRRRLQGTDSDGLSDDSTSRQTIIEAFFRASRDGDVRALLSVLDPDVVLRTDEAAIALGRRSGWLESELCGADVVARQFAGRADAARLATINGNPGAVWAPGGKPLVVFQFDVTDNLIDCITLIADRNQIASLDIVNLDPAE